MSPVLVGGRIAGALVSILRDPFREQFDHIREGMTRKEVLLAMRPYRPWGAFCSLGDSTYLWEDSDGRTIAVCYSWESDRVTDKSMTGRPRSRIGKVRAGFRAAPSPLAPGRAADRQGDVPLGPLLWGSAGSWCEVEDAMPTKPVPIENR